MTDDARRHWHGNPGDRHEHHNVWVQGGAKSPSPRAAWALTPEMMRRVRRVHHLYPDVPPTQSKYHRDSYLLTNVKI